MLCLELDLYPTKSLMTSRILKLVCFLAHSVFFFVLLDQLRVEVLAILDAV